MPLLSADCLFEAKLRMAFVSRFLFLALGGSLVGCGSGSAVGEREVVDAASEVGDAPSEESRGETGGSPADAAGACPAISGRSCNTITNVGSTVIPTCVDGEPPQMTGGTIVDGTYVLTASTFYVPDCASLGATEPTSGTLIITPGCIQAVSLNGVRSTGTWSAMGNMLVGTDLCAPQGPPGSVSYTATATSFSELESGISLQVVLEYRKM